MGCWLKRLTLVFFVILILLPLQGAQKVEAVISSIPIRVAVLYDSTNPDANFTSTLYNNVVRVLQWNKLPFDSLDISESSHPALTDASGNLLYSAAIIEAEGIAIDTTNSQNILAAINQGMGAISVLPAAANSLLKQAFGIDTIGTWQLYEGYFTVLKDKFTFSYANSIVNQTSYCLNQSLAAGTDIVAQFPDNQPAIWSFNYGAGKTVFHNTTATNSISYWGILLQSILYVMPIGVASPANVMALNVDDCPMPYYTPDYLQSYYYDFMTNYLRWLAAYQVKSTFYVSFSYSGNISDFWTNPQPLQAAASIVSSGNELGLHSGSLHLPLDAAYWGSTADVDTEVNTTNQTIQTLKQKLSEQYGLTLGDIKSYVAAGNCITDYGYQILNNNTTIKYVGEAFAAGSGILGAQALSQKTGVKSKQVAPALPDTISSGAAANWADNN